MLLLINEETLGSDRGEDEVKSVNATLLGCTVDVGLEKTGGTVECWRRDVEIDVLPNEELFVADGSSGQRKYLFSLGKVLVLKTI